MAPCSSTSVTAATALFASCSNGLRRPSLSCSCSMTSTGPTPHLWICSVRCYVGHRTQPCSSRWPSAPDKCRSGCPRCSNGRTARVLVARLELGALTRDEARELLGESIDGAAATTLYDETGGNPFYLEQLARSLGRTFESTAARLRTLAGGSGRSARRCGRAGRRARASGRTGHVSCSRGRRSPATRSTQSLRQQRRRSTEASALECRGRAAEPRPRPPDRRAPPLSLPAPTRPAGRLRVDAGGVASWARTSGAPKRSQPAVHSRQNARTMSSAPRAKATQLRSRFFAKLARQPHIVRPRARRSGSPARFASFPRTRRQKSGSSSCSRAQAHWRRPASSPRPLRSPREPRARPRRVGRACGCG